MKQLKESISRNENDFPMISSKGPDIYEQLVLQTSRQGAVWRTLG